MTTLEKESITLVETKYLISPNCFGVKLLQLAILELLFDGSLELKKEVKHKIRHSISREEFYIKKGMNFDINEYNLYQRVIINSFQGLNGYLSIQNLFERLHIRLEGGFSDFSLKFVKHHMNTKGWHGTTLFYNNYLSTKGKKIKSDIRPNLERATQKLETLLKNKSEHAISIINDLDHHLLLLENISSESATIINQLIRDRHSNLRKNLKLKKIDFVLLIQLRKTLAKEIMIKKPIKALSF